MISTRYNHPTAINFGLHLYSIARLRSRIASFGAIVLILGQALTTRAEIPTSAAGELIEAQKAYDEAAKLEKTEQFAAALPLAERSLALREQILGPMHIEVANSLELLARLLSRNYDDAPAGPLLQRALAIREAALGSNHPAIVSLLRGLAFYHMREDQPERAEALLKRALRIRETTLGPNHLDTASSLEHLALLYHTRGICEQAKPLYLRVARIRKTALHPNHISVATPLVHIAFCYFNKDAVDQAMPWLERSLRIRETTWALINLAGVYQDRGAYERAEALLQRSLRTAEAAHNSTEIAATLGSLARLYKRQGAHERIEPLLQRALRIHETSARPDKRSIAIMSARLGNFYLAQGKYTQAEPFLERAFQLTEANRDNYSDLPVSPFHQVFDSLAQLRIIQKRPGEAAVLLARMLVDSEKSLRKRAHILPESHLDSAFNDAREEEERLYSLLRVYAEVPEVRHVALAAALLRKGRSAMELAQLSRTLVRSLDGKGRAAFDQLRALRGQLAELTLRGPGQQSTAEYQSRLRNLETQAGQIERELTDRSALLRSLHELPEPNEIVVQVAHALPQDSALVELIAYEDRPLIDKPGTPKSQIPHESRYLALVLLPTGEIHTADLGLAAPLDQAVTRLHDAIARRDANYLEAAQTLFRLAFAPLVPLLGVQRRIFVSPDGQLGLIPFGVLHDGARFVADRYALSYLTSGKDLLRAPDAKPSSKTIAVFADPDFSAAIDTGKPALADAGSAGAHSTALQRFYDASRAGLADLSWMPLPGTRKEAEAIHKLLPEAQLFVGAAATKAALFSLPAPAILHVATHGFFIEDPSRSATDAASTRALGIAGPPAQPDPKQLPRDPLLRSGLVLAGIKPPATSNAPAAHPQASLVTALEMAGMNLWGTELVVLSACETGRGEVKAGQGIYGLRRALVIAGAETIVTSLWQVDDQTTQAFMEHYYRSLRSGLGRAEALDQAARAMQKQHAHPYYWAPFIAIGNGGPVRGLTVQR